MRRLGVDAGQARIGLAISEGSLALPVETIPNDSQAISFISEFASQRNVTCVYVGLPLSLSGAKTKSTQNAIELAIHLESLGHEVRMIDERLTTKSAHQILRAAGKNAKNSKGIVDAQAAALILDFALASEKPENQGDGFAGKKVAQLDA